MWARAPEPVEGEPLMRRRRARGTARRAAKVATIDLCRGPGNLTRALGISLRKNHRGVRGGPLRIEDHGLPRRDVAWSPRVGITVGVEHEWRCYVADSAAVSGHRP